MHAPILLASLAALGYTAWYLLVCAVVPFGRCRRCKGTGRRTRPMSRRRYGDCFRCHGTGRRVRLGRRAYTHLRRLHRNGTR